VTGWPMMRLDQCCDIVSGATPSTSVAAYWDGDIDWATPKDLSDLEGALISETPRKITKAGLAACSANLLPPGSVLFSSRAPIGHVAINTVPMATNQGFKSFMPFKGTLQAEYLYHWLRCNRSYLEGLGNGATFKEVSKSVVARIEIPVPPLGEQRRIAAILDEADALRAKRRAALAQLDEMAQAIFVEMFGDPAKNPHGWPTNQLGAVVRVVGGFAFKSEDFGDRGGIVVRISNLNGGTLDFTNVVRIPTNKVGKGAKYVISAGDILMAMSGATTGKIGLVPHGFPGILYQNQRVANFRITNPSKVNQTGESTRAIEKRPLSPPKPSNGAGKQRGGCWITTRCEVPIGCFCSSGLGLRDWGFLRHPISQRSPGG